MINHTPFNHNTQIHYCYGCGSYIGGTPSTYCDPCRAKIDAEEDVREARKEAMSYEVSEGDDFEGKLTEGEYYDRVAESFGL